MRYDYTQQGTKFDGKRVLLTTIYPEIPISESDIYVTTDQSQRLDQLSLKYYKDAQYWWVLAQANNLGKGSLAVPAGIQLRIPIDFGNIISTFSNVNKS